MIDLHLDHDANLAEVVLNIPKAMNSLQEADIAELSRAYSDAADAGVRALILRGEGKGFCAGRNIKGIEPENDDAYEYLERQLTPVLKKNE